MRNYKKKLEVLFTFIKHVILLAVSGVILVYGNPSFSQQTYPVTVATTIQIPYSPYFSDYFSPGSTRWQSSIIFNDFSEPEWNVKLRITIQSSKIKIQTVPGFTPSAPIVVTPGVPYSVGGSELEEYFQYNNLILNGITSAQLTNGRLPEGNYTFCLEVLDYNTGKVLSQRACAMLWIQINDEPITITPVCQEVIQEYPNQMIPFRWHQSNMSSPNSTQLEYQLKLYEVLDNTIDPKYAIQNNKVYEIYQSEFITDNSLIYGLEYPVLYPGKKYIYTVQVRDVNGVEIYKNNGVSQPCWFYYGYPQGGTILLEQPTDSGGFSQTDAPYFKWSTPSSIIPKQSFYYSVRIVKIDSSQSAEQAMRNNDVWHEEITTSTNRLNGFELVLTKKLETLTSYAWQVSAYTGQIKIAESDVRSFYGPPLVDEFNAGMHIVKVKSTFNADLNHLSGIGIITLSTDGKKQEIPFNNIRIIPVAGRYVLDYGQLETALSDTTHIQLNPSLEVNDVAYFYPKRVRLDKNSLEYFGNVRWELPHPVTALQKAFVVSVSEWINYDRFTLYGHAQLNVNNQYTLLDPYNFKLSLLPTSDFLINENVYTLRLDGTVELPTIIKGTDAYGKNVTLPFKQTDQLFYITQNQTALLNNILPIPNSNLVMAPLSYVIDLSEVQSPLKLTDNKMWKGVYFPTFRIDFNIDADKSGQLIFKKLISVQYNLTQADAFKNWIDGSGQQLTVTHTFAASDAATFNQFPAALNVFTLNVEKSSVQNSSLTGSIIIPFISTSTPYNFTAPLSNMGIQPGYLTNLDGTSFTFNKGSGDQETQITITRGVFADRERIDMTMDLVWPSLKIEAKSLTGFKAWGNYKIGFLLPNCTMTLSTQLNGKLSNYPVAFDAIGAGSSNGAYAFGITGKAVLAEDVSGSQGAPAVNIYSTVPNTMLPKEAYVPGADSIAAAEAIPGNVKQNSYEENVAIIANSFKNDVSSTTVVVTDADPDPVSEISAELSSGVHYISSELIDKSDTAPTDSSWATVSFVVNQQQILDEVVAAASVALATPFTDSITARVNAYLSVLDKQVKKIEDTLTVKIDRAVTKLVDSIAAQVIRAVKKPDFDPTESIQTIADTISVKLSKDIRNSVVKFIDTDIRLPLITFIRNETSGRVNSYVELQMKGLVLDLVNGKINMNDIVDRLVDNMPYIIHGISDDAFGLINMERVRKSIYQSGGDAASGIKTDNVHSLLMRAINAEAGYIVSKVISKKASEEVNKLANNILSREGGVTASAGIGLKMNFQGLGRNLKEGKVDQVVKLDAVSVALNTKFISFAGMINYTPADPVYGDIWKGGVILNVNIPKKFSLSGTYVNGRKDDMPYWFCQIAGGADNKGKVGEPMDRAAKKLSQSVSLGPVELVAASGRMYHHMTDIPGRAIVPDPLTNYGAGVSFVFFDAATHGTAIRLGVAANVEIREDGNYVIDFEGDVGMLLKNPTAESKDPMASGAGGIKIHYNSAEEHFLGSGWVLFNKGLCLQANFCVDVRPGYWSVQVGTRDNMIKITPGCAGWGAAGWAGVNQTRADIGLGLSYSINTTISVDLKIVSGGLMIDAGVAAGISAIVQYKPSIKLIEAGIWVDLWANINIFYKVLKKSKNINLVNIYCRGDLIMRFDPPPTTLAGNLRGHVSVLGLGIDFNAGFNKTL